MAYGAYFLNDNGVTLLGTDATLQAMQLSSSFVVANYTAWETIYTIVGESFPVYRPNVGTSQYAGHTICSNLDTTFSNAGSYEVASLAFTTNIPAAPGGFGAIFYDEYGRETFNSNRRFGRFIKSVNATSIAYPGSGSINVSFNYPPPAGSRRYVRVLFGINLYYNFYGNTRTSYTPLVTFNSNTSATISGAWSAGNPGSFYNSGAPSWQLYFIDI